MIKYHLIIIIINLKNKHYCTPQKGKSNGLVLLIASAFNLKKGKITYLHSVQFTPCFTILNLLRGAALLRYTYCIIHLFKLYDPVGFSVHIELCNYHHNQF